ncbi:MAG: hypothetical protein IJR99_17415 [Kiritimatiellae bacterium]|nr:hypothetical protein [Kiritimatiellia bacterium]
MNVRTRYVAPWLVSVFGILLVLSVGGETIVDFSQSQWKMDFGKFAESEEAANQLTVGVDGLTIRIDRGRDNGRKYGSIVLPWEKQVPFTATNRTLRLRACFPKECPITMNIALRFRDDGGECFQYRPARVIQRGELSDLFFQVYESTISGETWGGNVNRKWDGAIRLCEINFSFNAANPRGAFRFVRLETSESVARTVTSREPVMPLVEDKSIYYVYGATSRWENGRFRIDMPSRSFWMQPSWLPPGPPRLHGAEEMIVMTEPAFEGGVVELCLGAEGKGEKKKTTKPWKPETRFPIGAPFDTAWYLHSLAFILPKGVTNATFVLKGIDGVFRQTAAEACRLDVRTGNGLHILNTPDAQATLLLSNPADRAVAWRGVLRVRDYFGRGSDIPVDHTIGAGKTLELPVPPLDGMGIWRVTGDIKADDGSEACPETRFAVIEPRTVTPAWTNGTFRFGVNYHIERYSKVDRALTQDALVAMGAKLVRSDMCQLASVCPQEGVYHWEQSDTLLGELESHGISVDAIIYNCPYWARTPEKQTPEAKQLRRPYCFPCRPGIYRAFCERLAARYGTRIAYYEIGNEWDLTDPKTLTIDEGIAMQREAYAGLHAGCAGVTCIPNGWAALHESSHPRFHKDFQRRMMTEARDAYDVYPIHLHGPFRNYAKNIRALLEFMKENDIRKPWYSNETALTSVNGAEDAVAVCVWQKILFAWAHGSVDYIWYNLRGTGFDPSDGEQGYGLITGDFYPRAGYAAFSALAGVFGELKFDALLADTEDRLVGRWKGMRGGESVTVLAGWDEAAHEAWPIRVATDAVRVRVCDLMGNRTEVPIVAGHILFPLATTPSALIFEQATFVTPDTQHLARAVCPPVLRIHVPKNDESPDFILDAFTQVFELYQADPAHIDRIWKGPSDLSAKVRLSKLPDALRLVAEVTDDIHAAGDRLTAVIRVPGGELQRIDLPGADGVDVTVRREGVVTHYEAKIRFGSFGLSEKALAEGIRFNLFVKEDDGQGPDGWMEYLPGMTERNDPLLLPLVKFE